MEKIYHNFLPIQKRLPQNTLKRLLSYLISINAIMTLVRDFKRDRRPQGGRDFAPRDDRPQTMFKTICSDCGKECEVPFKPNGSKPVFCRDCFQGKRRFEATKRRQFSTKKTKSLMTEDHNIKAHHHHLHHIIEKILPC
jgi:CxxC-x17-CxxC domain-containing protein